MQQQPAVASSSQQPAAESFGVEILTDRDGLHFHTFTRKRRGSGDPGPFLHFFSASKNINMSHDIYPCLLALLPPLLPLPQVQK